MTLTSAAPPSLLVPEGTRLVHIGPPKTGTTAIQLAFHAHRDEVLAQGVRYAGRSRHSGSAVLAVLGRPSFQGEGEPPPMRKWRDIVREIRRAKEPRVVFSSEFFAEGQPERIRAAMGDLDLSRVHVVVTLRPLASIIPSQWQQYVQSGLRVSYENWLRGIFGDPGSMTPTFWRRHRHDELVARWADLVGPGNMTVVVLDEQDHNHVLRVFEQLVGLREGTLVAERDVTNRSMSLPEIEAVRAFTIAFKGAGLGNALFHKVIHFGTATYMKERTPGPDEPRIETPQWALDRAGEIAREMVPDIAASGVRVVGDLDSLTAVGTSGIAGDHLPAVSIPPDVAASMAMGVLVSSGLARRAPRAATGGGKAGPRLLGREGWLGQSLAEPPELARVSTYHLAGVLALRARNTVVRRARSLVRRVR